MKVPHKIAIMGAGAIGSVVGGMLARKGHRVMMIGRAPHMNAINNSGLHISGIWGEFVVSDLIARTEAPHEQQDVIFLTVKSFDTDRAAREMLPMVGSDTIVVSIQNGLGNIETLSGIVGKDRTIGGSVIFGAVILSPGHVRVTAIASETLVGEIDGSVTPRVERLSLMLDNAGIPTRPSDNILRDIWYKALYNIALNPLSALFQVPYGPIADNPDTRWLIRQMVAEAFLVAEASGMDLGSPLDYLKELWEQKLPPTRHHISSMLQDIRLGRRTEIDYINGAVVRLGELYGIDTPYNKAVVRMVKAREVLGNF